MTKEEIRKLVVDGYASAQLQGGVRALQNHKLLVDALSAGVSGRKVAALSAIYWGALATDVEASAGSDTVASAVEAIYDIFCT